MTEQFVSLSRYDFLVVFIGILLGLSVSRLISFFGQVVSSRKVGQLSFCHTVYLLLMFLMQVHYWWKLWDARSIGTAGFAVFLQLLLLPILMYLATAMLCPDPLPKASSLLEGSFAERDKRFYSVIMAMLVVGAIQGIVLWNQPIQAIVLRGLAALLLIPAFVTSSKRFHTSLAIVLTVLFLIYVIGAEISSSSAEAQ